VTRIALTLAAGAFVLPLALGGCVHTLVASGAFVIADEVLPPIGAAAGIVIDIPKLRTEIQGFVDPDALVLPPQPVPR